MFFKVIQPFLIPLLFISFMFSGIFGFLLFNQQRRMTLSSQRISHYKKRLSFRSSLESELSFYTQTHEKWVKPFLVATSSDLASVKIKKWVDQYFFSHSELSLISFSQNDASLTQPQFFESHLLIECLGPYKAILQFIYDVGEKEPFTAVQSIQLKNVENNALICTVNLHFLVKKDFSL